MQLDVSLSWRPSSNDLTDAAGMITGNGIPTSWFFEDIGLSTEDSALLPPKSFSTTLPSLVSMSEAPMALTTSAMAVARGLGGVEGGVALSPVGWAYSATSTAGANRHDFKKLRHFSFARAGGCADVARDGAAYRAPTTGSWRRRAPQVAPYATCALYIVRTLRTPNGH